MFGLLSPCNSSWGDSRAFYVYDACAGEPIVLPYVVGVAALLYAVMLVGPEGRIVLLALGWTLLLCALPRLLVAVRTGDSWFYVLQASYRDSWREALAALVTASIAYLWDRQVRHRCAPTTTTCIAFSTMLTVLIASLFALSGDETAARIWWGGGWTMLVFFLSLYFNRQQPLGGNPAE